MEPLQHRSSPDDYRVFSRSLDCKVRSRHHAEYASWHCNAAWNGRRFERYPEYIIRATSVADVVHSLLFARTHGLGVSVKGSGHSYAACFLQQDGILLDLSLLNELEIVPDQRLAVVGPGVTSAQLTRALSAWGLAFPTGHGGSVGLGGFLLGGGLGINCDAWGGMSVFNLVAVDVVTADGELLHADERENSDLLWAARGAGPCAFFVVTKFYLRCWPAPKAMTNRSYRLAPAALASTMTALSGPPVDPRLQVMLLLDGADAEGMSVVLSATAFCDHGDEATRLHRQLRSRLGAVADDPASTEQAIDFEAIYRQTEAMMQSRRYRADNVLTDEAAETAGILLDHLPRQPSRSTRALVIPRPAHEHPDAAFSVSGKFFVSTYAQWNEESDDEANRIWLKSLYDALEPHSNGCYINEFDLEERGRSIHRCYSGRAWARLGALRARHDPDHLFQEPSQGWNGRLHANAVPHRIE